MPEKDPKIPKIPKEIKWKGGERSPEQTRELNRKAIFNRGFKAPQVPSQPDPLEGLDPDLIKLARMKAEHIIARTTYDEQLSALAHIDKTIAGKTPAEMIEALDGVILAAKDKQQLASEIELALAFLFLTDDDSTESQ